MLCMQKKLKGKIVEFLHSCKDAFENKLWTRQKRAFNSLHTQGVDFNIEKKRFEAEMLAKRYLLCRGRRLTYKLMTVDITRVENRYQKLCSEKYDWFFPKSKHPDVKCWDVLSRPLCLVEDACLNDFQDTSDNIKFFFCSNHWQLLR